MLKPQENATREVKSLNGLWRFAVDSSGLAWHDKWWTRELPGVLEAAVPSSFNDLYADPALRDHVGEVWYQTTVSIPPSWRKNRVVLRLGAATHRAVVWVDDTRVAEHEGGYTPFEADLTDQIELGQSIRITVLVDNRLSWTSVPPGLVLDTDDGPKQLYFHDFYNYAGLHRPVWLCSTPHTHIRDISVITALDGTHGRVHYRVDFTGDPVRVQAILHDADGVEVAQATGAEGTLAVQEAHPWKPGEGYLYRLAIRLFASDQLVDTYALSVGIRTLEVQGTKFLFNGEPFYFRGFGRHEDGPVRGKGYDPASLVQDFSLLEWIGANSIRTSHYPYAEEVLEYADRHGIVIIAETAAVGMNVPMAGRILAGRGLQTFSPDTISTTTQEVHAQSVRELIARDKNHPCIALWSLANEPECDTQAALDYFEPLFDLTRRLDPTRPVGYVNGIIPDHREDLLSVLADVIMVNRYYGWYFDTGDLKAAERSLRTELNQLAEQGKPILVTEYGADSMVGLHSHLSQLWTEKYQAALLEMHHRVFDEVDAVVGEHVWSFADFATGPALHRIVGNRKGVFSRDRQPKAAAYVLRRRWRGSEASEVTREMIGTIHEP